MAAQPIKRRLLADIKQAGGWEKVFERIASGETQTGIAKGFGVSQGFLSRILNQDEERRRAFREAKRQAAQAYADEAKQIVDDVPADRDEIAKARERAGVRKWLAGVYDREQFGEPVPGLDVTLNVGELHLAALRHRTVADTPRFVAEPERGTLASPQADDDDDSGAIVLGADR